MSILNRLNRIIRSNVSDLRSGGRSESLDQALGEMESSLKDARRQKVQLHRQEKKLVAAIRQQRDKADQWEERAMMALKRGEEDLAREALLVRNEAMDEAAKLREELEEHRMYLQDIDSALEALELKLEGTRGRLRSSSAPSRRPRSMRNESDWDAEFRRRVEGQGGQRQGDQRQGDQRQGGEDRRGEGISSSTRRRFEADEYSSRRGPLDDDRLFDEVDRMGSKIDAFEAEVEAMRELSDDNLRDPGRRRLEERFRRLEDRDRGDDTARRSGGGSDDLADLKKKFED